MRFLVRHLMPIFFISISLALTGCFEKKEEEITAPSTDSGGGGGTTPPSNNYGYVTLNYPSVSGTYKNGWSDPFPVTTPVSNIVSPAVLSNFTVSPSLPAGLTIDSATGAISGTVQGNWINQNYTVSAQKPDGEGAVTATFNFGFSQNATAIDNSSEYSDLRYPQSELTLVVGQAMTAITPTYSGPAQDITFFGSDGNSFSPMFGDLGLSFDNNTGMISGTPFQAVPRRVFSVYDLSGSLVAAIAITVIEGAPTNLHYTNENATYPVGHAITTNTPSASGGNVASYSVTPALPAGLSLNTTTGEITGTPSVITAAATYTITATNIAGSTQRQISVTVSNSAPANLSYVNITSRYTVGASITTNTPIITGGGQATSFAVNPALPAGLTLDSTSGIISGMPTAVTAAASYTVTAANAIGSTNKIISIEVVNPGSHVLYAANGSVLKAYSVDEVTGEPIFIGKQITSDIYSKLSFHPTSDCAFGFSGSSVAAFSVNKSAYGELTSAGSSGGLSSPLNMVMSADGKFLFVLNNQDPNTQFIRKFEVNPADCTLSNAANFSVQYSTTYAVRDLALAGNNIYVNYANDPGLASSKIRHLKFDNSGTLSFQQDYSGGGDRYITAKASGSHIYSSSEQNIKAYSIDGSGNLTFAYNYNDNSILMSSSVTPVMDAASDRFIAAIRNGFNAFGVKQVGFANDGTVNSAAKIEGSDVIQYYSQWLTMSAHTSQSGTYIYSTYNPVYPNGAPTSAVRLKIESNGAVTSKGPGLIGHISGY